MYLQISLEVLGPRLHLYACLTVISSYESKCSVLFSKAKSLKGQAQSSLLKFRNGHLKWCCSQPYSFFLLPNLSVDGCI